MVVGAVGAAIIVFLSHFQYIRAGNGLYEDLMTLKTPKTLSFINKIRFNHSMGGFFRENSPLITQDSDIYTLTLNKSFMCRVEVNHFDALHHPAVYVMVQCIKKIYPEAHV